MSIGEDFILREKKYSAGVYAKRNIVVVKGKGARVWDIGGREYVDCVAGNGSCLIGHSHPEVIKAVEKQIEQLSTCPGIFYNDVRASFLEKIIEITPKPLNKVFLSNSGTESVEAAVKLARKHMGRKRVVAMKGGFHGRTMGSLSLTWKKKYRAPFEPLVPGVDFARFNDPDDLRLKVNSDTAAVIIEPVQGETGVIIPSENYLREAREICDEKEVLMILDEVQTGLGRTGKMFACQHWGVVPDIMCLAKGLAGGLPVGVTVAKEEVMDSLSQGEHGNTYGGNPVICAAGLATINVILKEKLPEKAHEKGRYFLEKLREECNIGEVVRDIRGIGLMLAVESRFPVPKYIKRAVEEGVLLLTSGTNIIRMLPPLCIEEEEIDVVVAVLKRVLSGEIG